MLEGLSLNAGALTLSLREGGLPIRQDARVLGTLLAADETVEYALDGGRLYWLSILPAHGIIFNGMAKRITEAAHERYLKRTQSV